MLRLIVELAELAIAYVVIALFLKLVRGRFARPAAPDRSARRGQPDPGERGGTIVDAEWEEIRDDPP